MLRKISSSQEQSNNIHNETYPKWWHGNQFQIFLVHNDAHPKMEPTNNASSSWSGLSQPGQPDWKGGEGEGQGLANQHHEATATGIGTARQITVSSCGVLDEEQESAA